MKKAFTLAEVLITLAIIGVVAALIVPAISNLRPDKNKTAYLQAYDTITDTVKSLAGNSRIYPVCKDPEEDDNVNCSEYPLFNTNRPMDDRFDDANYQGDKKLCSLMGWSFGVDEDDMDCSDTVYQFNAANYTDGFANTSFTTKNGMRWRVVPTVSSTTDGTMAQYQTDIYLDIDPTNNDVNGEDKSCIYAADSCEQPDIFKFMVAANGDVTPADPMGQEYIKTRKSLTRKKYDIQDNLIASMSDERAFEYVPCNTSNQAEPDEEEPPIPQQPDEPQQPDCLTELLHMHNYSSWMSISPGQIVCNRVVNTWNATISQGAMTVRLNNGAAASTLNFSVPVSMPNSKGGFDYNTLHCSIPSGGNSCSVATEYTMIDSVNLGVNVHRWISPKYDGQNFYVPQGKIYDYFSNFLIGIL